MANSVKHLSLYFILSCALCSCEKDFDIEYRDIQPIPVIEASLSLDGARVSITETTPMDELMNRTRYTDAVVTITDLTSGEVHNLSADSDGYFISPVPGVVGHDYELSVARGLKHYSATSSMLAPAGIADLSFSWIKMPYDQVAALQIIIDCGTSDIEQSFWILIYKNGEFYKQSIVRDTYSTDGTINVTLMTSRRNPDDDDDDDVLLDGDLVTATVAPISASMYDYLEGLLNNSNSSLMFAGDFCLGYFLASPVAERSVTYRPDEF